MKFIQLLLPLSLISSVAMGILKFSDAAYILLAISIGLFFALFALDSIYRINSFPDQSHSRKYENVYELRKVG